MRSHEVVVHNSNTHPFWKMKITPSHIILSISYTSSTYYKKVREWSLMMRLSHTTHLSRDIYFKDRILPYSCLTKTGRENKQTLEKDIWLNNYNKKN